MSKKKNKENVDIQDRVYKSAKELKVPKFMADCFYDIANGITGNQIIDRDKTLNDVKKNKYIPKTKIPYIVEGYTNKVLKEIHEDYKWKDEMEFKSDSTIIKIIDYPIYDDGCIIQRNDCKPIKVNKKYLKELYEDRGI